MFFFASVRWNRINLWPLLFLDPFVLFLYGFFFHRVHPFFVRFPLVFTRVARIPDDKKTIDFFIRCSLSPLPCLLSTSLHLPSVVGGEALHSRNAKRLFFQFQNTNQFLNPFKTEPRNRSLVTHNLHTLTHTHTHTRARDGETKYDFFLSANLLPQKKKWNLKKKQNKQTNMNNRHTTTTTTIRPICEKSKTNRNGRTAGGPSPPTNQRIAISVLPYH